MFAVQMFGHEHIKYVEKPMLANQTFFKHLRNVGEDKH